MGAKGRAAKGQADWRWRALRKPLPPSSELPGVLGRSLAAVVSMSHHPQEHLLLMGECQKGLPLKSFVALLVSGACLLRAAQLWLVYIINLEAEGT